MDKDLMITLSVEKYGELLEAKIQRDIMLNIAQNVPSYNVADYVKNVFGIKLKEDD